MDSRRKENEMAQEIVIKSEKMWFEAWYEDSTAKLGIDGTSLQDMRNEIDLANRFKEKNGCKAMSMRIIECHRIIKNDDLGEFSESIETRKFVELYPQKTCIKAVRGWVYDDGGRSKYFKAEKVGDCVTRAISIATGKDYKEVYDAINKMSKSERTSMRKQGRSNARNGVYKDTFKSYLLSLGWKWHPTMSIGSGCRVHLKADELPSGTIIVSLSKHLTCMIDGVIHDTYDCSREGTRCVYGYFTKE